MNIEGLRRKLVRVESRRIPADTVPYAFEQRVLHAIRRLPVRDAGLSWIEGLWRSALCSVAVAVVVGGIHFSASLEASPGSPEIADADLLEVAVLAELPEYEPNPDTSSP